MCRRIDEDVQRDNKGIMLIMYRYNMIIDLCADFTRLIKYWFETNERSIVNKKDKELWYEYFILRKKTIDIKKRKVLYSKEFQCPEDVIDGFNLLVQKFKDGKDVNPHLSKTANNPESFDGLLYDWGVYHFHLGKEFDNNKKYIIRTGPVLFAIVDDRNVYLINIYDHGRGKKSAWAKKDILRIISNNWPHIIKPYRIPEGKNIKGPFSDGEYELLRKNYISTVCEVNENEAYLAPGGGFSASGHSTEIVLKCNKINNTLKQAEINIKEESATIVNYIEETTCKRIKNRLCFMLWWEYDNVFSVIEMNSRIKVMQICI